MRVYLETGSKRVFAGAVDWPGYSRSGRDETAAIEALVAYGTRYADALGAAAAGFIPPATPGGIEIVERVPGGSTTDFGSLGDAPAADERPVAGAELEQLIAMLEASWVAFDRAAAGAAGSQLRVGPRGGGRQVGAIIQHVLHADAAYLGRLGGRFKEDPSATPAVEMARVRALMLEGLRARAREVIPAPLGRRTAKLWSPRYTVRRSAWHALDHAWEIEDRLGA